MSTSYTRDELIATIKSIDDKLNSGISSVTTDGTTTTIDFDALRRQKRELQRHLDSMQRATTMQVDLSKF